MQSDLPWNISGISTEAREAARAAARREGLSIGEWLTRRITQPAAEGTETAPEVIEALQQLLSQTDRTGQNTAVLQATIEALRARLDEMPSATQETDPETSALSQRIETLIRQQQEFAEQANAKIAVLAGTMAEMSERTAQASSGAAAPADVSAQIGRAVAQTDGRISALSNSFVSLSGSMDLLRRDFREAMGELGTHLSNFDDRLRRMEDRVAHSAQEMPEPSRKPVEDTHPDTDDDPGDDIPDTRTEPTSSDATADRHSFDLPISPDIAEDDVTDGPTEAGFDPDARLDVPWRSESYDSEEDEIEERRRRRILIFLRFALIVAVLLAAAAGFMTYRHISFHDLQQILTRPQVKTAVVPPPVKTRHTASDIQNLTALAKNGNSQAMLLLGIFYADGTDVPADSVAAEHWLKQASSAGEAIAQYRLGILFEGGHGIEAAPDKAATQFSLAAKAGNLQAMYLLASAYSTGTGVDRNAPEAAHWYSKAAGLGLADAAYNLAELYEQGDGVAADNTEAYKWYAIAAAEGVTDAGPRMEALAAKLSADDLTNAQQAAKDFRPATAPAEANTAPDIAAVLATAPAPVN